MIRGGANSSRSWWAAATKIRLNTGGSSSRRNDWQEGLGKLGLKIERLPGGHLTTDEQPGAMAALIAKFERGLAKKQSERFLDAIPDCPFTISREATAHFVSVRWVCAPVFSHEARLQLLWRGQFHLPFDILAQSNRGRKLCAFIRYCLYRPCFTTVTIPTLRSTRRCLEAVGCVIFMRPTISLTVQYLPSFRSPIISRRFASAIALKTSVVVAALAMGLRSSRIALER